MTRVGEGESVEMVSWRRHRDGAEGARAHCHHRGG